MRSEHVQVSLLDKSRVDSDDDASLEQNAPILRLNSARPCGRRSRRSSLLVFACSIAAPNYQVSSQCSDGSRIQAATTMDYSGSAIVTFHVIRSNVHINATSTYSTYPPTHLSHLNEPTSNKCSALTISVLALTTAASWASIISGSSAATATVASRVVRRNRGLGGRMFLPSPPHTAFLLSRGPSIQADPIKALALAPWVAEMDSTAVRAWAGTAWTRAAAQGTQSAGPVPEAGMARATPTTGTTTPKVLLTAIRPAWGISSRVRFFFV